MTTGVLEGCWWTSLPGTAGTPRAQWRRDLVSHSYFQYDTGDAGDLEALAGGHPEVVIRSL